MKIAGYQIHGFSRRFWIIAAIPVVLLLVWFFFLRGGEEFNYNSAIPLEGAGVSAATLSKQPNWAEQFIAEQGGEAEELSTPEQVDALTFPAEYTSFTKPPTIFRFKVFVPPIDEAQGGSGQAYRPDLYRTVTVDGRRWALRAAVVLDRSQRIDSQTLEDAKTNQEGQPVVLFTPLSEELPAGVSEVTAMLFWHTDSSFFRSATTQETTEETAISPIFLVADHKTLNPAELRAPTTHTAKINLEYREGPLSLAVKDVEWSANNEVRVCMAIKNQSRINQSNWIAATDPSQITATASEGAPPAQGQYVREADGANGQGAGQTVSPFSIDTLPGGGGGEDYIAFPASVASPDKGLILRMPVLSATVLSQTSDITEELKVTVLPKQIREVKASDSVNSCGTTSAVIGSDASVATP